MEKYWVSWQSSFWECDDRIRIGQLQQRVTKPSEPANHVRQDDQTGWIGPWPEPFQNLQATHGIETYPAHIVVAWIGHCEIVARKYNLQTTDAHVENPVISKSVEGSGTGTKRAKPRKLVKPSQQETREN